MEINNITEFLCHILSILEPKLMISNNYNSVFVSCSALEFHMSVLCYYLHAEGKETLYRTLLKMCGIRNKQYNYFRTVYMKRNVGRNCYLPVTVKCLG
jgi:hypothetical protein